MPPFNEFSIVQATIRLPDFVERNHLAYSPDYHIFLHLKKFMQGKNFHSDNEAIQTVDDYLCDLDFDFFSEGIQIFA